MRYINTERLGVIETDRIVTKSIGWIFREQSVSDVGLDAIIEQVEKGNPTGKLIAIQIKSGKGNFHLSEKKLTYYVSNIHYNYWLSLNIPIVMVAHLPETDETYWQQINYQSLKKTKKHWKIEISKNQNFNEKSKKKLTEILSNSSQQSVIFELYKGEVEPETIFDLVDRVECISESVISINKIVSLINELRLNTNDFNSKLNDFVKDGLSDKDFQVKSSLKGFGRTLNLTSKRLENEIMLFAETFSVGFYAYEQIILIQYFLTKDSENLNSAKYTIENIPKSIHEALVGIKIMKDGVFKLPKKYPTLKEARILLLDVIDMLIFEFNEASEMTEKMTNKIAIEK